MVSGQLRSLRVTVLVLCALAPSRDTSAADVYFSPRGGCEAAVVKAIASAKKSVRVQAYSFTSQPIASALIAARARGVEVSVIADAGQREAHGTVVYRLRHAGIELTFDHAHAIAHNKVMVLDDTTVITGSFNFTASAEAHNAENLLILRDRQLAQKYLRNWHVHRAHARK